MVCGCDGLRASCVFLVGLVIGCSCSGVSSAGDGPLPTLAGLPKTPTASLAAESTINRPPVRAGVTRLAQFDIDVALPPDATVYESSGSAYLLWSGCSVSVISTLRPVASKLKGPRVVRRVGALELACVAGPWARNAMDPQTPPDAKCLAICDRMTPVPRSTAEERYPTVPPVIEIEHRGGFAPREEGTLVWSDGTVQYSGPSCKAWRGRRGTLAPERVAALLSAAERGGFFAYHRDDSKNCVDSGYGTITIRKGSLRNSLRFDDCDSAGLSKFVSDLQQAIGRNPC